MPDYAVDVLSGPNDVTRCPCQRRNRRRGRCSILHGTSASSIHSLHISLWNTLPAVLQGSPQNNDVAVERAGYLYFLRLINSYIPGSVPQNVLVQVIERGLETCPKWESAGAL